MKISDLAAYIDQSHLNALKEECGGLQTLLKNHNNIFDVFRGNVQLKVNF